MGVIRQLPEDVAIKIAAGEVVERPASVVKELVENALDAGASRIEVHILEGGKAGIEVRDNGNGMDAEDAVKAFLRHGTSKIQSVDDLLTLTTLGFRGEALAAIGNSADVELITSQPDAASGTRVVVSFGSAPEAKPHAPQRGTIVRIQRLFESLPARLKFLKSDVTEWKATLEILVKQMTLHPSVAFLITHNNRTVYDLPDTHTFLNRVAAVWDVASEQLIPIEITSPHQTISGVIGKPELAHMGKAKQFLAINNHPINDKMIARAVREAYGPYLPNGMQPWFALSLTLHPGMVDVNIHPRKEEVRFVNSQDTFRFVLQAVSQTLSSAPLAFTQAGALQPLQDTPFDTDSDRESLGSLPARGGAHSLFALSDRRHFSARTATFTHVPVPLTALPESSAVTEALQAMLHIDATYIVTEHSGKLMIIDQHAAHERILYNQFVAASQDAAPVVQSLLLPLALSFSPLAHAQFKDDIAALTALGFSFVEDESGICITAVPQAFAGRDAQAILLAALTSAAETSEQKLAEVQHRIFATLACKAAVKAGDAISESEMHELIASLLTLPDVFTCPHGRPSYVLVSVAELEKLFKRTGF